MTTWSKTPPSEPGWHPHRWTMETVVGYVHVMLDDDGTLIGRVGHMVWPMADLGGLWLPRIPSPEAIDAAKDALREAIPHLPDEARESVADRCRQALAKLEEKA